ncbi:TPA: glucosamine inositolphosphorylceramide transferase family protein [Photobacterium damselae]
MSMLLKVIKKIITIDNWRVGIVDDSWQDIIKNKKIKKINWINSQYDYEADPFLDVDNNEWVIYYEALSYWKPIGFIKAKKINDKGMVIDEFRVNFDKLNGHASYPYIISDNEETFCIPENKSANELYIYVKRNNQWVRLNNILTGKYVDSGIIFHNNKYYLFTTQSGNDLELLLFYSDEITGPYKKHPMAIQPENLPRTHRGGGQIFWDDINNEGYRVTQAKFNNKYGTGLTVRKILKLSDSEYEEDILFDIDSKDYHLDGIHTLSCKKGKILIDGRIRKISVLSPIKNLIRKLLSR